MEQTRRHIEKKNAMLLNADMSDQSLTIFAGTKSYGESQWFLPNLLCSPAMISTLSAIILNLAGGRI